MKALLVLSLTATLNTTMADTSSVCTDALQRVCKDTETQRSDREAYVSKLKKEISDEASKISEPLVVAAKAKIPKWRLLKRAAVGMKIRNREIMRAAQRHIGPIESVITSSTNEVRLRNYMNQAIDSSNFTAEKKNKFKDVMKSIKIGNFADYVERSGLEDSVIAQLLNNPCGSDGMVDNAFATTLNGQRYVLICPGFLITLSQTPTDKERFDSILQAIPHEMGHHIDNSKEGNEVYSQYLGCLAKNYPEQFKKNSKDTEYCAKPETKVEDCNNKVVVSHAGELIADQWGIRVLGIHARTNNYTFGETDQLLTDSWSKLCGSGDEGTHPTGDFRIGTLMRVNPGISSYMNCDNSKITKPACTFNGEEKI